MELLQWMGFKNRVEDAAQLCEVFSPYLPALKEPGFRCSKPGPQNGAAG